MAELTELTYGQSTELPDVDLRAHLTGGAPGVELHAVDAQGKDAAIGRIDPVTVLVGRVGHVRLVARPASGPDFPAGTRIGLDVRLASTAVEAEQVLVPATDAGALTELELARLERTGAGWRMLVPDQDGRAGPAPDEAPGKHAPRGPLDEREHPWLTAGRAAVRRARGGQAPHRSGEPWGLVLDGSYSMRASFPGETLGHLVEMVAGILAESSGRLPVAAVVTGLTRPVLVDEAVARPQVLVDRVLEDRRPPSWNLATPAVRQAVAQGARAIAVVTDGVPADFYDLAEYANGGTSRVVLVVSAGPLHGREGFSSRLSVVELEPTADGWESAEMVHALTGDA
ncbi:hypothetical protein DJ010_00885 [Nocardioides silvaticus]|uniref:Uncharacterized protein n=1 Tax=Nocardioides silvaticus TaxID=2201891 RepID=A0A316TKT8_9ACTN|nr:hypothetical protein [Nocardioides silvaticus]PWN04241.1 hypothetical protein DJ010_00885 [Nocardioides silvaticus]